MLTFAVSTIVAIVFVVPVLGCGESDCEEPECRCTCVNVTRTIVKNHYYDYFIEEGYCSVVTVNSPRCECDLNGEGYCEVQPRSYFVMLDPNETEGLCSEEYADEGILATPKCRIQDRTITVQMPESPPACIKPLITDLEIWGTYYLQSGKLSVQPFDQGLRDYWATLRVVYSTARSYVYVCGIYGEAKLGPNHYNLTRGANARYNSTTDVEIKRSYPNFILVDAGVDDSHGVTAGGVTAQNLWNVSETDGWCVYSAASSEPFKFSFDIEFTNMRNMVGILLNSRASDSSVSQLETPVIASEYFLAGQSGATASMFDQYGASLDEHPQSVRVELTPTCGCP